jgi:hypothetical protein
MKSIRYSLAAALMVLAPAAVLTASPAAAEHLASDGWNDRHYRPYRDHRPPRIVDVTPDHGDRVGDQRRTRIAARFQDAGSGVDPASVRLRVDGRDVTHYARVNDDGIRFREDLAPGRHVAELVVRDRAGNATRHAWSFVVVDRGYGYSGYGQPHRW